MLWANPMSDEKKDAALAPASPQVGETLEQECRKVFEQAENDFTNSEDSETRLPEDFVADQFAAFIRTKLRAALAEADKARAEALEEAIQVYKDFTHCDESDGEPDVYLEELRRRAAQPTPAPKEPQ
jgi:hypothetical protein